MYTKTAATLLTLWARNSKLSDAESLALQVAIQVLIDTSKAQHGR